MAANVVAYLALGSNLGDRQAILASAIQALGSFGEVCGASSLYETEPEGAAPQPPYLNAAVRLSTTLAPGRLLEACLAVERDHGRVRPTGQSKAPRTLDIDILLYGDQVIDEPGLLVPHPSLLARPFVRLPLADVALPGLRHPISGDSLDCADPHPSVRRFA